MFNQLTVTNGGLRIKKYPSFEGDTPVDHMYETIVSATDYLTDSSFENYRKMHEHMAKTLYKTFPNVNALVNDQILNGALSYTGWQMLLEFVEWAYFTHAESFASMPVPEVAILRKRISRYTNIDSLCPTSPLENDDATASPDIVKTRTREARELFERITPDKQVLPMIDYFITPLFLDQKASYDFARLFFVGTN